MNSLINSSLSAPSELVSSEHSDKKNVLWLASDICGDLLLLAPQRKQLEKILCEHADE